MHHRIAHKHTTARAPSPSTQHERSRIRVSHSVGAGRRNGERERPADRSSCVEPMPSVEANARQRCDIYLEAVGSFHGCCCWDKARRTISACDAVQRVHVFWRSRWFPPRRSSTFPNPDPRNKKCKGLVAGRVTREARHTQHVAAATSKCTTTAVNVGKSCSRPTL